MSHALDRLGEALLDASLAAVAISGLVVLAMVQCRQPSRRLGWARAGLVSTLALLPLAALNPVPRIDVRERFWSLLPIGLEGSPPARTLAGGEVKPPRLDRHPGRSEASPAQPVVGGEPISTLRWPRQVARGMVVCYLAGASLGVGWIWLGLWGSAWLVRRARAPSKEAFAHCAALPFEGRARRPGLRVSDRVSRSVLVGIVRPTILIPAALDGPGSAERLRLSLLHELAHAEGADHRFGPAASLAVAIWFFLPSLWWIRGQMKLDQEFLADRRAVAHFGTIGCYASSLVELAAALSSADGRSDRASTGSASSSGPGSASALFQRVLMLVRCPFAIEGRSPAWWRWSTAMTLALATLSASCLTLRGLAGRSPSPVPEVEREDAPRSIRFPQLSIAPREHDDRPFDLRLRLPTQFSLSFEVMAEPTDLSRLEVLGHPLGPVVELDPARPVYRLWHRVQIRRAGSSEVVLVDDRPVLEGARPPNAASWLTIRPLPGQSTRIRELELSW